MTILTVLLCLFSFVGPDDAVTAGERGEKVAALVRAAESGGFSGSVLAAKDGKVVAAVSAGFADLDHKIPNTPGTLFEIASATKQFTAAAVLRLVQDGKVKLDDPISRHLPGVPESCSKITVRHLLQHTSGIPGSNSQGAGEDLSVVLPVFLGSGPQHPPGTHFEYWNQGYSLLSEIIARDSGESYAGFCKRALFAPAGMKLTCFTGDEAPVGAPVAVGVSGHGQPPRSALEHPYGSYGFQYRGMGGVVTSVLELWRWDRALREEGEKAVLNAESRAALFAPGLNDYALGWFVKKDPRGKVIQSHGGSVRGFVCEIRRLPDDDGCVFVLSNRDDARVRELAEAIQGVLVGTPGPGLPLPLPADLLAAIAGEFKDAKGNVMTVTVDGGVARINIKWAANAEWKTRAVIGLNSEKKPVLFEGTQTTPLTIRRGAEGAVTAVSIGQAAFERIK